MNFIELFILAIGLSMDAFAVAISKGLCMKTFSLKKAAIVGLYFGGFQALMPLIGYLLGFQFQSKIVAVDHWISFILLGLIGVHMIREAFDKEDDNNEADASLHFKPMLILAIATSIDALAVGVTFAFLQINILSATIAIGICTFILSAIGVKIGNLFGSKYKSKAELFGGAVLVIMAFKILIGHLMS